MIALDIRPERAADVGDIRTLVLAAFGPDKDTADFVETVRREVEVQLAEVALSQGAIVGHAQWCSAPLTIDGVAVRAAYLSCLSVDPALQGRGIGWRRVPGRLPRSSGSG